MEATNEPTDPNSARQRLLVLLALALLIAFLPLRQWQEERRLRAADPRPSDERYLWLAGEAVANGLYLLPATVTLSQLYRHFRLAEPENSASFASSSLPQLATVNLPSGQLTALHPRAANIFFLPLPLNQADEELLTVIPGIGPKLAAKIVAKRRELGGFADLSELRQVRGIGPKTLAVLANYVSCP